MRTTTKSLIGLASTGLLIAALTGCAQSSDSNTTDPGAGSGASAPAEETEPSTEPTPALETEIGGEVTEITLDAGFVEALTTLGLTPGVLGDAGLSDEGVLSFPITGGNVTYYDPATGVRPYVQGEIDHEDSGLSLTAGDTTVELRNFVIDPGNDSHVDGDVFVNGEEAAADAELFRLDGSTLNPVAMEGDAYVLEGTTVYISETAAGLLNETFGTDAVTGDLEVGIAKLTVTAAG